MQQQQQQQQMINATTEATVGRIAADCLLAI
jgi:hypothetical protein